MNKTPEHLWQDKIWKLLLKQSTPAVIWMLVMALYNLVDTIFIGRWVGTEWIAAVSVVFPIQMIIWAFAMTLGIGSASIISRKLWAKEYAYVSKIFWTFQTSNILFSVLLSILWLLFVKPLLVFFGATPEVLWFGIDYFSILLFGMVFLCFNMWNNDVIRSVWNPRVSMFAMLSSALLNTILDPIFIFWFDMWIKWAAWATVISRITASSVIMRYYLSKNNIIKTTLADYKIKFAKLKEILLIWIPSLARQVAASGVVIFINNLLWAYWWGLAIAAYGIVNRALMVFMMPMFGIVQWMQPILWYNHGAWYKHRVKEATILSIKILTIFCTLIWLICLIYPSFLIRLFSTDQELLSISINIMRIVIFMFPLIWFQIVASWFYQALWKVRPSFRFAILRQVLILLPILIILPKFLGLDWISYSFPISDLIAAVIIFFVFKRDLKKIR